MADPHKHFARLQLEIKQAIDHDLPIIIGNEAVRLFKKNFQDEGFFGKPWQQVKRRQTHTVKYKTKSGMHSRIVPKAKGAAGTRKILFDKKRRKPLTTAGSLRLMVVKSFLYCLKYTTFIQIVKNCIPTNVWNLTQNESGIFHEFFMNFQPNNSFTLFEIARPSAFPASCFVATAITLPISCAEEAPI